MILTQLNCGERAVVTAVEAPAPLKDRLRSLNIRVGAEIVLLKISPFQRTFLIQAGSVVAVRKEVAECVTVRKK